MAVGIDVKGAITNPVSRFRVLFLIVDSTTHLKDRYENVGRVLFADMLREHVAAEPEAQVETALRRVWQRPVTAPLALPTVISKGDWNSVVLNTILLTIIVKRLTLTGLLLHGMKHRWISWWITTYLISK